MGDRAPREGTERSRRQGESPLDSYRSDIVGRAFLVFLISGGVCLVPALWLFARRGTLVKEGLPFAGLYAAVVLLARSGTLPLAWRGLTLVAGLVASGVGAFLTHGFYSDARGVLLVATVFASVVLGTRAAFMTALLSAVFLSLGGLGVIHVPSQPAPDMERPVTVVTLICVFVAFSAWGAIPIAFVVRRFVTALEEQQQAVLGARSAARAADEAARALAEGKGLLDAIIEHAPALVSVKDVEGRYTLVNRAFEEVVRAPASEILGKTDHELLPLTAANRVRAMDLRVLERGEAYEAQGLGAVPAEYITVKFPIRSTSGDIVAVGGISTDVTEVMQQATLVAESEARARAVFEAIWHAMLIVTIDGAVVEANQGALRLFGHSRDEWLALPAMEFVAPSARAAALRALAAPGPGTAAIDARCVTRWGAEFEGEIRVCPLPLQAGDRVLVLVRDVTPERELERRLRARNADLEARVLARTRELEATNRELEAFSYSVSHDLRAPLRHVAGYVGLLEEHAGSSLPPEARAHLEQVESAAARMARLIEDLLRFARIGTSELKLSDVDLRPLVLEVIDEALRGAEGRKISFEVGELPVVKADRALLRQAIVNLVSNAVKFTRGRPEAHVEIGRAGEGVAPPDVEHGLDPAAADAVVFVKDDGVGFDMRYAGGLFGVFQRMHAADAFEGTGVGLAHVKRIVARLGGHVWAKARPGDGATFFLSLKKGTP